MFADALPLSDKPGRCARFPLRAYPHPAPPRAAAGMQESPPTHTRPPTMDNEQINAIGTLLADLSARTEQLRGYL